jgi:hypothetical protein
VAALLLALCAAAVGGGNLLANGGFEELAGERPARWDVFVAPFPAERGETPEAASASVSQTAAAGTLAVTLRNPLAYPTEPYNNWSQNVLVPLGGKTVELSGRIKTEDAEGGAGLWVQCWRKNPLRVIAIANTAVAYPLYGTVDWSEVKAGLTVPAEAELLTVRCVLKGAGQAWFDEISLSEAATPEPVVAAATAAPAVETAEGPTEAPKAAAVDGVEQEFDRLREANMMLAEALEAVREDNRRLLEDLLALRENMRQLQEALGAGGEAASTEFIPPLVPRDFDEPAAP